MPDSRKATNAFVVGASGRGIPTGGIKPARNFLITFSSCSEFRSGCAKSTLVHENPPDFTLSLWQTWQYLATSAFSEAASGACARATTVEKTNRPIKASFSRIFLKVLNFWEAKQLGWPRDGRRLLGSK